MKKKLSNLIITAAEKEKIKIDAAKRELMGDNFRNHNGKRSQVERNDRKVNKRWNCKDKRNALNGD